MQVQAHRRPLYAVTFAICALLLAATAVFTSSASAKSADTTFGLRDYFKPERTVERCEVIMGGKLAVAGVFTPGVARPSRWGSRNRLATTVVRNPLRHSSKTPLSWHRQSGSGFFPVATAFGEDGTFLQLTQKDRSPNPAGQLYELRKTTQGGRAARRFSGDGRLQLRAPEIRNGAIIQTVRLLATRDGGVIVAYFAGTDLHVLRYAADGKFADWGNAGTATIAAMNPINSLLPSMRIPLAETADGGLLVTANIENRDALVKLDAKGAVDAAFGTGGHWLPPAPSAPANGAKSSATTIGGISVDASGKIAVLYATQQTFDLGTASEFHAAHLESNGSAQQLSPKLGEYNDGGDGGFPSATPSDFKLTPSGVVLAYAETYYPTQTFRFYATKWVPGSALTGNSLFSGTYSNVFGVGSFAIANSGDTIYGCGSYGTTKTRIKKAKHLGVRRIGI